MNGLFFRQKRRKHTWIHEYQKGRLRLRLGLFRDKAGDNELTMVFYRVKDFDTWEQIAQIDYSQVDSFLALVKDASASLQSVVLAST